MNPEKSVPCAYRAAMGEAVREAAEIWVANRLASPVCRFFRRKAMERFCMKAGFVDGLICARRLALDTEEHETVSDERIAMGSSEPLDDRIERAVLSAIEALKRKSVL